jgi:hypothetical protein
MELLKSTYTKMFLYTAVTGIITFVSLLDTIDVNHLNDMNKIEWLKIILKSSLPSLVSLKAFLDTSVSTEVNNKPQP